MNKNWNTCCNLCGSTENLSNWDGFPVSMDFCHDCETNRDDECTALFAVTAKSYFERARQNAKAFGKMEETASKLS